MRISLLLTGWLCSGGAVSGSFVNKQVLRSVDATGAVINVRYDIKYQRLNDSAHEEGYRFALPADMASTLSFLRVSDAANYEFGIRPPVMFVHQ